MQVQSKKQITKQQYSIEVVRVNTIQTRHMKTHNKQTKWKKSNP